MKVGRLFKPTGKRLENLNDLIQTKYPQDKWVLEPILPIFLSIIDSSSTIEQQEQVIDLLTKVFNDYEFRYNTILENTIIMSEEFKRMQELAGLPITENKVEETKETINENFVGIPAINNIFEREKTDYELAFEHFTKSTSILKEEISSTEVEDYLIGLFDQIDLGDEYEEGPQTFIFEKNEYADEDLLGGEEAAMFIPAHEYLSSKGEMTITDPMSGAPVTFSTEGENIVASWNTEDFSELD